MIWDEGHEGFLELYGSSSCDSQASYSCETNQGRHLQVVSFPPAFSERQPHYVDSKNFHELNLEETQRIKEEERVREKVHI